MTPTTGGQSTSLADVNTVEISSMRIPQSETAIPLENLPSIPEQQTVVTTTVTTTAVPLPIRKAISHLPAPVQRLATLFLMRVANPYPETLAAPTTVTHATRGTQVQEVRLGWLPTLTLTNALALFIISYAYGISRLTSKVTLANLSLIEGVFMLGVLLMFCPIVARLLSPAPSRFERIGLLCVAGLTLYFVQVTNSPLHFSGFDEFLHWRTVADIGRTGHLFSENTLLPVSPYYAGLEIVTNALSSLTGLSDFISGLLVLGVARLLVVLALFLLFEQVTKSPRMAALATAIYMTNPHFISFDVEYSYESLAIPVACFLLFLVSRLDTLPYKQRVMTVTAWFVLGAIALAHHVTSYVFAVFLLLWMVTYLFQRPVRPHKLKIMNTALFSVAIAIAVALIPGNPVVSYLSSYFGGSIADLVHVFEGIGKARPLFVDTTGLPSPIWNRLLIAASVGIIMLALPIGLFCIWLRHRFNGLALMFGIAVLGYPVSQAFRFTSFGSEITDRSAAFLFIPIAYVLTILITQIWPTRTLTRRGITLITSGLALLLIGGILLQAGPGLTFLPGPYLVTADSRSIEPQGIEDALWASPHLGPNNPIYTDRTNSLLMTTYGDQYVITHLATNINESPVFFAPSVSSDQIQLLKAGHVHYLVVDLRLSTATPLEGIYFESGEPGADQHTTPIPQSDLTKFDYVSKINRVFDSGAIVIYDTQGLLSTPTP